MTRPEIVLRVLFVSILFFEMFLVNSIVMTMRGQQVPENLFLPPSAQPIHERSAQPQTPASSPTTGAKDEWISSYSTNAVIVATRMMVLTEQWSEPPVIPGPGQYLAYTLETGEAATYEVRDADYPVVIREFGKRTALRTGGNSGNTAIDKYQWRALGIKQAPVEMKIVFYHRRD